MKSNKLTLWNCPAPAKINWFLHVIGREPDTGYHQLQTVFQLIDWYDFLDFCVRTDGEIQLHGSLVANPQDDLCVKAAKRLQQMAGKPSNGVEIWLRKNVPMGAGLGGGSSDAATTLLALNHLWGLNLSLQQLADMALPLGADIPFFIMGQTAFGEGRGERLTPIELPTQTLAMVYPNIVVPTQQIFMDQSLTRDQKMCIITDFLRSIKEQHDIRTEQSSQESSVQNPIDSSQASKPFVFWGLNALESVAVRLYPEIKSAMCELEALTGNPARMSGSGSTVFSVIDQELMDCSIANNSNLSRWVDDWVEQSSIRQQWQWKIVRTIDVHPLRGWYTV